MADFRFGLAPNTFVQKMEVVVLKESFGLSQNQ